jgi:signal transduction histidine kinase
LCPPIEQLALFPCCTVNGGPNRRIGRVAEPDGRLAKGGAVADDAGGDRHVRVAVIAAEVRSGVALSSVGMVIMTTVLVFIATTFAGIVAPLPLGLWLAWMAGTILLWGGSVIAYFWRRPDAAAVAARWAWCGRAVQSAMTLGIAVSVWLLLPHADDGLRALMLMLFVWYVATLILASSAAIPASAVDLSLLIASAAGFVVWSRMDHWAAWLVFIVMAGVTMLGFRTLVRRAVIDALAGRVASERAEVVTRHAFAAAAAERDAKTRFIASASHDLQQPLQAASLFFESAIETGDVAARARAIAGARAAFASTQALIGQMLDHLRLEAGAVAVRCEPVALKPLLQAVAAEHDPTARAAGMRLIVVGGAVAVQADEALLCRALGNLVTNAIRHGQGERVLLAARRRGAVAELWVIDDGNGIAVVDRARLFNDYAQGSDHGGQRRGGFGLGLASVRRSLALMGGTAILEPRWTGGAAFKLTLPLGPPVAGTTLCKAA